MNQIEHSKDPTSFDDRCVQWADNAGCCSWPCEVEIVRRQRDALQRHSDTHKEWCPHLVRANAAEAARDALAAALANVILEYSSHSGEDTHQDCLDECQCHLPEDIEDATTVLDAHAPGWRSR